MQITGTVVYNDIEGGFWGIVGDDGKNYCPVDGLLPAEFQQVGLKVEADAERSSAISLRMWGRNVEIKFIKIIE